MRRAAIYGLFFLSGVSALIYELIWQRLLNLVFGVSTLAVSAVLAAFMGGLALGGFLCGRFADRTSRPLRLYAWLEFGIGTTGLLVPAGFGLLTTLYPHLHAWLAPDAWTGAWLRFALSLLVLAVPATLIGATLPVMGRLALRRSTELPAAFSWLYAVNTLGGVLGAALTGFVLLRLLGMELTLWIAAGLNFWVGFGALILKAFQPDAQAREQPSLARRANGTAPWLALACAALTGTVCTGFEVVWMRILGILTSNSAYGFALLLTVLLLGLAVGSLLQALWSRRPGDSWRRLALCQWLLAGATLAALPFFHTAPDWLLRLWDGHSAAKIFLGELALTAGALFLPAVLMGMSLPLLVAGLTRDPQRFGHWLGRLYALNTLGCVAGPFLAGFVLIPWLGIHATVGILLALALFVGLLAWARVTAVTPGRRCLVGAGVLAVALAAWFCPTPAGYFKSPVEEPRRLLYYREGNCGTVSVIEEPHGIRNILVDGQPVAGTDSTSVVDQKMLAHLPLLLHPEPHRALTVGFGSGGTSHSMTLHGIDVDCVEIEAMVPAAAECFESENHGILTHPRFHLILDDARSYLRVAPVPYDVIVTDCTNIQYRSNGDLYTVEYFQLMKDRLTEQGVAAAWVPANGIRGDDLKTLLRSFQQVFPHTSIWYMNTRPTDFLIVVGTAAPLTIDLDRLRQRMAQPEVAADLAAVGLTDPCRLLYTFLAGADELQAYLEKGPLNTDDRPVLSYSTYGANLRVTCPDNLLRLLACRTDVARHVQHPAPAVVMLRHYVASNEALLGHIEHQRGDEAAAFVHYYRGATVLAEDPTLRALTDAAYATWNQRPSTALAPMGN